MINDGTKKYDHSNDASSQQLGGCMRDFRNKPYPVKARVRYENKVLSVSHLLLVTVRHKTTLNERVFP